MEPPSDMEPDSVRNEKVKVLRSLRRFSRVDASSQSVRGQYTEGVVGGKASDEANATVAVPATPICAEVIQVVPASCKTLVAVGEAVVELPAARDDGPPGTLLLLIGIVGLVTIVMILRQLR